MTQILQKEVQQLLLTITPEMREKYALDIENQIRVKIKVGWNSHLYIDAYYIGDLKYSYLPTFVDLYIAMQEGLLFLKDGKQAETTEKGKSAIHAYEAAIEAGKETLIKIPVMKGSPHTTLVKEGYTEYRSSRLVRFYYKEGTYYSPYIALSRANQRNIIIKRKHIIQPTQEQEAEFKRLNPILFRKQKIANFLQGL